MDAAARPAGGPGDLGQKVPQSPRAVLHKRCRSAPRACKKSRAAPRLSIAVLRHAERADDAWDASETWLGSADEQQFPHDPPLSRRGFHQARAAAQRLAVEAERDDFVVVVSSPFLRCVQTAVVACQVLGVPLVIDKAFSEAFAEQEVKDAESLTRPMEVLHTYAKLRGVQLRHRGDFDAAGPAIAHERVMEARARYLQRFLEYLHASEKTQRNALIVTHCEGVSTIFASLYLRELVFEPAPKATDKRKLPDAPKRLLSSGHRRLVVSVRAVQHGGFFLVRRATDRERERARCDARRARRSSTSPQTSPSPEMEAQTLLDKQNTFGLVKPLRQRDGRTPTSLQSPSATPLDVPVPAVPFARGGRASGDGAPLSPGRLNPQGPLSPGGSGRERGRSSSPGAKGDQGFERTPIRSDAFLILPDARREPSSESASGSPALLSGASTLSGPTPRPRCADWGAVCVGVRFLVNSEVRVFGTAKGPLSPVSALPQEKKGVRKRGSARFARLQWPRDNAPLRLELDQPRRGGPLASEAARGRERSGESAGSGPLTSPPSFAAVLDRNPFGQAADARNPFGGGDVSGSGAGESGEELSPVSVSPPGPSPRLLAPDVPRPGTPGSDGPRSGGSSPPDDMKAGALPLPKSHSRHSLGDLMVQMQGLVRIEGELAAPHRRDQRDLGAERSDVVQARAPVRRGSESAGDPQALTAWLRRGDWRGGRWTGRVPSNPGFLHSRDERLGPQGQSGRPPGAAWTAAPDAGSEAPSLPPRRVPASRLAERRVARPKFGLTIAPLDVPDMTGPQRDAPLSRLGVAPLAPLDVKSLTSPE